MFTKNSLSWMASRKILGENTFVAVLLIGIMFTFSIYTDYFIRIFAFETLVLSMILITLLLIYGLTIIWVIKRNPEYVQKPRRTFQYAPPKSVETVLLGSLLGIFLLSTLLFGITTDTLIVSLMIAATIMSIFLPLKIFFLRLWINRLGPR